MRADGTVKEDEEIFRCNNNEQKVFCKINHVWSAAHNYEKWKYILEDQYMCSRKMLLEKLTLLDSLQCASHLFFDFITASLTK